MSTVTFDTYRFAQILRHKGFTQEQTEGLIDAAKEIDLSRVVTTEVFDLRLREMELRLKLHIGGMIFTLGGLLIAVKYLG